MMLHEGAGMNKGERRAEESEEKIKGVPRDLYRGEVRVCTLKMQLV